MDKSVEERLLGAEEVETEDIKSKIWTESKKIWRIAFPGIIARVTSFGTLVVTQLFLGHISALDLAAYALVQTFFVRFVNGILVSFFMPGVMNLSFVCVCVYISIYSDATMRYLTSY